MNETTLYVTLPRPEERLLRQTDDQAFIAEVPWLPGCAADGKTNEEVLENLEIISDEWIETAQEPGRPIPEAKERLMVAWGWLPFFCSFPQSEVLGYGRLPPHPTKFRVILYMLCGLPGMSRKGKQRSKLRRVIREELENTQSGANWAWCINMVNGRKPDLPWQNILEK